MINTRVFAVPKENCNSKSVGGTTTANSSTIRFDTQLSNSSQNGVQNKVIYAAIIELIQEIANTDNTLELLRTGQKVTINSNTWKYNTDTGNLYFNGTVNVNNLLANAATVGNLNGTDLDFTNADIDNLNSADAIIENLTVTKAAHFFELIIDQIKSTQGQIIITAANAKLDRVTQTQNGFHCSWKNTDGDRTIYNQFAVNDLVVCQSFNLDKQINGLTNNLFTNINQYWSASNTFQTFNNSGVTINDGEAVILPTANTCFLAQSIEFEPETQYTLKWDMKQDKASECDVSILIHKAVIDKTKPFKTNIDNYVQQQDGDYDAFDVNLTDEYRTYYITFTTKSTLPDQSNLEFVCVNLVNDPAEQIKTYITNPTLLQSSQKNKYYWSKVINVGTETINDETYNYIDLSTTDYDTLSNGVPEAGDEIAQLGNKTNKDRQAAIVISAYNSQFLDPEIKAPSIVQYSGINDYNLSNHRLNVISKSFNLFKGNFTSVAGADLEEQITNNTSQIQQTNQAITTEVRERINGDKKYFPIIKPMYDYTYELITDYKTEPLRYKGDSDIYSTPTFLETGTYKVRIFVNSSSLGSNYAICYHGNQFPSDLGSYDPIDGFTLSYTGKRIIAKDNTDLYEFTGEVTISENGYYGLNWWETLYMYVPEETDEFETNYSRITQTNTRITQQVANINGQISTINQKADSIELAVNDTNLRLDNGQFTINADTNVNGNLSITSASQGFVLNNTYGNTYIVGDSIGTFDNFKQKNYIIKAYSANVNADATTPSTQTYEFNYSFPIGQLGLNTKIEFNDISFVTHKVSDGSLKSEDSYDAYITLYKEGEDVCQWVQNNTHIPTNYYTTNATTPYSYSISIRLICGYSHYQELLDTLNCAVTLKLKEYTQTFNIIGYDGIASNFGANKTFYVGNEGTYVKYDDDKILKVSTNGIQKYAGSTSSKLQNKGYLTDTCYSQFVSEYSPISGVAVRKVTSLNANPASCYLQPNDEMIVFKLGNSAQGLRCNVYLGLPASNTGRKVYLKQMGNYGNIYAYGDNYNGQTNKIRTADGYTTSEREIDNRSRYFISDGEYWIEYYCG